MAQKKQTPAGQAKTKAVKKKTAKKTTRPAKAVTKKAKKKTVTKKEKEKKDLKEKKYFEAVGRRKKAIARVRLFSCSPFEGERGKIEINGKPYDKFFPTQQLQNIIESSLKKMKSINRFTVTIKIRGGGIKGQAEAARHGIARALISFNADFRKKLKRAGYLKRDPRKKERKKPGLKKARRAPQWKKR